MPSALLTLAHGAPLSASRDVDLSMAFLRRHLNQVSFQHVVRFLPSRQIGSALQADSVPSRVTRFASLKTQMAFIVGHGAPGVLARRKHMTFDEHAAPSARRTAFDGVGR